jgi:hypothetical protein
VLTQKFAVVIIKTQVTKIVTKTELNKGDSNMTKEKLKTIFINEFKMVISNKVIYQVNLDYLNEKFEELYENLSKTIKISNLDNADFIYEKTDEDKYSVAIDTTLCMYKQGMNHIRTKVHFFIVKTSKYVSFTLNEGKITFLPNILKA